MFLDSLYTTLKGILTPFLDIPLLGNIIAGFLVFLDGLNED